MTPTDYVVPAERVVAVLKGNLWGLRGEKPHRQAPMSRSQLLDALKIKKPREQRRFAQQLQHMSHKCYAAYRISFQYYPTGWIYDPPPIAKTPGVGFTFTGQGSIGQVCIQTVGDPARLLVAVDAADIKIACEWAAGQWVSGPARNAFKRLREAAK